jgi:hypothetical protein
LWSRKDINIDEIFSLSIAYEIKNENDDPNPDLSMNVKIDMIGKTGKMQ